MTNLSSVKTGYEFEEYIAKLLSANGFTDVTNTPKSGDYGIDVLASKDKVQYAIQCKLYRGSVGPGAVQEASTGKAFYNAHVAVVATNSRFTASAKVMAEKVGVVLWDKKMISSMEQSAMSSVEDSFPISNRKTQQAPTSVAVAAAPVEPQAKRITVSEAMEEDPLYAQVVSVTCDLGHISASVLQRRFNIVQVRANRLFEIMEMHGFIEPFCGSSVRKALVTPEEWERELNLLELKPRKVRITK